MYVHIFLAKGNFSSAVHINYIINTTTSHTLYNSVSWNCCSCTAKMFVKSELMNVCLLFSRIFRLFKGDF